MAQMCVSGKQALYRYCDDHGIPYRNCGKLIVATTPHETEKLQSSVPTPRPTASATCKFFPARRLARWSRR